MNWLDLTAPEFVKAVEQAQGVCVIAVGVLEKHGEHLPLGTDVLVGQKVAEEAAAREPVVVFPQYCFGQIFEAMHQPGTVAIRPELQMALLENLCEEIARNGLKKIVLLNAHGGNEFFLSYFAQTMLSRPRDYHVYVIRLGHYYPVKDPDWQRMKQTDVDGHAGESETSMVLAAYPQLVKMEAIGGDGMPARRLAHLPNVYTAFGWYADYPDHYSGDAKYGSVEKGRFLMDRAAENVAGILRAIKTDTAAAGLAAEFYGRCRHEPEGSVGEAHPTKL